MKEKKHSNSTEHLYKIFIYVVLILLAVIIIVPVAWVFMASITARPLGVKYVYIIQLPGRERIPGGEECGYK